MRAYAKIYERDDRDEPGGFVTSHTTRRPLVKEDVPYWQRWFLVCMYMTSSYGFDVVVFGNIAREHLTMVDSCRAAEFILFSHPE